MAKYSAEIFRQLLEYDFLVEKATAVFASVSLLLYLLTTGQWVLVYSVTGMFGISQAQRTMAYSILYTMLVVAGALTGLILRIYTTRRVKRKGGRSPLPYMALVFLIVVSAIYALISVR